MDYVHYINRPSVEMWAPTNDDLGPQCNPNEHPHEVMFLNPDGAIYQNFMVSASSASQICAYASSVVHVIFCMKAEGYNGMKATCVSDPDTNEESMIIALYEVIVTTVMHICM